MSANKLSVRIVFGECTRHRERKVGAVHKSGPTWDLWPSHRGREKTLVARKAPVRQVGGDDAMATRIGAVVLPLGVVVLVVAEYFHLAREVLRVFPAVFMEYARSNMWTADHLAKYFGFSYC